MTSRIEDALLAWSLADSLNSITIIFFHTGGHCVAGIVAGGAAVAEPGTRAGVGGMGRRHYQRGGAPGHDAATAGATARAPHRGRVQSVGVCRRRTPAATQARTACGGSDAGSHAFLHVEWVG